MWLKDFKERQTAMGVTQGQLADMAGISRVHLSRLMNDKRELTGQHKALLDAALEKLQPDALTAKVDYVRIRFPAQDVRYVIEDILWLRMRHIGQEPCCFYFRNEEVGAMEVYDDMTEKIIPVYERYALTIKEAACYFRIGENKLRRLAEENPDAPWLIRNGNCIQIRRRQFEKMIDSLDAI